MNAQLCLILCHPLDVACQTPLSMDFSGKNTGMVSNSLLQGMFQRSKIKPFLVQYLPFQALAGCVFSLQEHKLGGR